MSVLTSAFNALRLYLLRRRQYDNLKIRKLFREQFDIDVGMYSYGCFDRWRMPGPMRVGRYCSVAVTVHSALQNHRIDALTTHPVLYDPEMGVVDVDLGPTPPLVIEDGVWIGHYAMILPGCKRIGRGAIVGAGSIVTRDVAPYTIVAGNPARKVRDRFSPALAEAVEASQWWLQDFDGLRRLTKSHPDLLFNPTVEIIEQWLRETAGPKG
jgi:acetyltransferase-like isoleucine patch superfamily enzyme